MEAETFRFENEFLPVYVKRESFAGHAMHSEIAHWHDHMEILVIEHGSVSCIAGGTEFSLYRGDVCFINRRQLHRLTRKPGEDSSHLVLIIGTGLLSRNPMIYEKYIRPVLEDSQFSHIRFEGADSHAAQIAALAAHSAELEEKREPGYELDQIATIHRILHQIYLAYISSPKAHTLDLNARIQQQMAEYIYAHFAESLTLDDIAASGSISRSQCSKLFRQYTSLSPIRFLNLHRLELSREMLRSTSSSIAEIALNCGFSDQSYFNRLFVREYGITPLTYRKGVSLSVSGH